MLIGLISFRSVRPALSLCLGPLYHLERPLPLSSYRVKNRPSTQRCGAPVFWATPVHQKYASALFSRRWNASCGGVGVVETFLGLACELAWGRGGRVVPCASSVP